MPKIPDPLDHNEDLQAKLKVYDDVRHAYEALEEKYGDIADPFSNPVPGVEYDDGGLPLMPPDLTAITSEDLGRLFQAMEAFDGFFRVRATLADMEKTLKKESLDLIKAHLKLELKHSGVPTSEIDDRVKTDPRYIRANAEYLKAKMIHSKYEDYKAIVSRRYNLVSREITRRGGEKLADPDRRFSHGQETRRANIHARGAKLS